MAQSRRKRKRAKARGDRPSPLTPVRGQGSLQADWIGATVEDAALLRQAVREDWPTENGEAILKAIASNIRPAYRPRQALRAALLLLCIDRHQLRRATISKSA